MDIFLARAKNGGRSESLMGDGILTKMNKVVLRNLFIITMSILGLGLIYLHESEGIRRRYFISHIYYMIGPNINKIIYESKGGNVKESILQHRAGLDKILGQERTELYLDGKNWLLFHPKTNMVYCSLCPGYIDMNEFQKMIVNHDKLDKIRTKIKQEDKILLGRHN